MLFGIVHTTYHAHQWLAHQWLANAVIGIATIMKICKVEMHQY